MRFYIRANGRLASITVPEPLANYLIASLGKAGEREAKGRKAAQAWVNNLAKSKAVPEHNVSQWVQAEILDRLVNPYVTAMCDGNIDLADKRCEAWKDLALTILGRT